MSTSTSAALAQFVNLAQGMLDAHMAEHFPSLPRKVLTVEPGRRYARIVVAYATGEHRSVYCFVDTTNGDVLKAATWKAPAKHARGSIFAANPIAGVNPYGANYLV